MNKSINRNQLKLICMIAMTINHLGFVFRHEWTNIYWRWFYLTIGWIVFPILIQLLMEGYEKTSSIQKYKSRVFIAYLVAIIPYQWMFPNAPINGNVMWGLYIALWYLQYYQRYPIASFVLGCVLSYTTDWSLFNILFTFLCKQLGVSKERSVLFVGMGMAALYINQQQWMVASTTVGFFLAYYLLKRYNGTQKPMSKRSQLFFYYYYPLHIAIITGLHTIISKIGGF